MNEIFSIDYIHLDTEEKLYHISSRFFKIAAFLKLYCSALLHLLSKQYDFCYKNINLKGNSYYKDFVIVILQKLFRYRQKKYES